MPPLPNKTVTGRIIATILKGSNNHNEASMAQQLRQKFNYAYQDPPAEIKYEQFLEMLSFLRQTLFPFEGEKRAYHLMGSYAITGHFEGVGKVNRVATRVLGADKSFEIFIQQRTINLPFAKHEVKKLADNHYSYATIGLITPVAFEIGVIQTWLENAGAKKVQIACVGEETDKRTFDIKWE
jgi:uncharacterized protein (TIGR02265 family)